MKQNKKGNVAVIAIVIIIIAITAGIMGWSFAKKSQMPVQSAAVAQPLPVIETKPMAVPLGWKTYTSNTFNASISLPSDWKLILPSDGSLTEPNEKFFDGDLKYGFLASFSSPDKKENITFMNGPFYAGSHKCEEKYSDINNQKIREITCLDVAPNEIPGRYNYEFVDKNLVLVVNEKTVTIDKIITFIKFNDDLTIQPSGETELWQIHKNDKFGIEFKYPKEIQFNSGSENNSGSYSVSANYDRDGDNYLNFSVVDKAEMITSINMLKDKDRVQNLFISNELSFQNGTFIQSDGYGTGEYYFMNAYYEGEGYAYHFMMSRPKYSKEMLELFEKIISTAKLTK